MEAAYSGVVPLAWALFTSAFAASGVVTISVPNAGGRMCSGVPHVGVAGNWFASACAGDERRSIVRVATLAFSSEWLLQDATNSGVAPSAFVSFTSAPPARQRPFTSARAGAQRAARASVCRRGLHFREYVASCAGRHDASSEATRSRSMSSQKGATLRARATRAPPPPWAASAPTRASARRTDDCARRRRADDRKNGRPRGFFVRFRVGL